MGETTQWSPWRHLREHHPQFRVHEIEFASVPGGVDHLGCVDHYRQIIWLDSRLCCREQRATLAHEVGHLHLDRRCGNRWAAAPESKVDRWAARRLIALPALLHGFAWSMDLDQMAEELWVDRRTLGVRLRCLKDEEQDAVMQTIGRKWVTA